MQAVVPAAGTGTRLRPLTDSKPKGLVNVAGDPLLTHCFDRLLELAIDEIVVVIGYRGEQIVDQYGDQYENIPIRYVEQAEQKGLAHAVLQAESEINGDFLVLNGDNVLGCSLNPVMQSQDSPTVDATLLVEKTTPEVAQTTGVVSTTDDEIVTDITEKPDQPSSTLVTTGVYVLPESIFTHCRDIQPSNRDEYELADAITRLRANGGVIQAVERDGWRVNVNTPADRDRAARKMGE